MNGMIKIIILEDDPAMKMQDALDIDFPNVKFQIITSIKELLTIQDIGEADIFIFDIDMSKDTEKIGVGEITGQDTKIGGIIMALYYLIKRNTYLDKDCIIYTVTGRDDDLRYDTNYGGIYNLCKLIYENLGFKIDTGDKNYKNAIKYTLKELAENLKKNFVLLNWIEIINIYNNARLNNNNIDKLLDKSLSLRSKHSGKIRNILIGSLFSFCKSNDEQINAIWEFIIKTAHKGEIVRRLYERAHGELHKGNRYIINRSYQDDLKSIFDKDAIDTMSQLSNNSEIKDIQEKLINTYFKERADFINNYIGSNDDNDSRTENILKLFFRIPLISYIIHRNRNMVIKKNQKFKELYIYGNSINTLTLLDEILDDYNDKLSINLKDQRYCQSVILIFSSNKPHDNFNLYINFPQGGSLNNIKKLVPEIANGLYLFNKKGKEITLYDLFKENNEELSTSGLRNYLNFNDEDCKALILVIDYAKHTQAPLTLEGNN
jgi:hypothetical protein